MIFNWILQYVFDKRFMHTISAKFNITNSKNLFGNYHLFEGNFSSSEDKAESCNWS